MMGQSVAAAFERLNDLRDAQLELYNQHIFLEGTKDEDEAKVLKTMLDPTQKPEQSGESAEKWTPFAAFDDYAGSKDIERTIEQMESLCKQVQQFPTSELMVDKRGGLAPQFSGMVGSGEGGSF